MSAYATLDVRDPTREPVRDPVPAPARDPARDPEPDPAPEPIPMPDPARDAPRDAFAPRVLHEHLADAAGMDRAPDRWTEAGRRRRRPVTVGGRWR
jgi:hypothetical protein